MDYKLRLRDYKVTNRDFKVIYGITTPKLEF